MPNAGTRSAASVRRLAVGNPSVPPRPSEAERLARGDELGADPREIRARELLRLEAGNLRRELDHQGLLDPEAGKQLEPPLEGRQQRHLVAEDLPRVRVERDDGR